MKSRFNFCGNVERCPKVLSFGKTQINLFFRSLTRTFATVLMMATAITIVSCSQDDDDYNSEMYTLAEQMSTRGYGDPGNGGGNNPLYEVPCTLLNVKFYKTPDYMGMVEESSNIVVKVKWRVGGVLTDCATYQSHDNINMTNVEVTNSRSNPEYQGKIPVSVSLTAKKLVPNDSMGYDTLRLYANHTQSFDREIFR